VSGLFVLQQEPEQMRLTRLEMRMKKMANQETQQEKKRGLSLDGWAVGIALLLAALVRLGALKHVGW
jgi:hypothetical protein